MQHHHQQQCEVSLLDSMATSPVPLEQSHEPTSLVVTLCRIRHNAAEALSSNRGAGLQFWYPGTLEASMAHPISTNLSDLHTQGPLPVMTGP